MVKPASLISKQTQKGSSYTPAILEHIKMYLEINPTELGGPWFAQVLASKEACSLSASHPHLSLFSRIIQIFCSYKHLFQHNLLEALQRLHKPPINFDKRKGNSYKVRPYSVWNILNKSFWNQLAIDLLVFDTINGTLPKLHLIFS